MKVNVIIRFLLLNILLIYFLLLYSCRSGINQEAELKLWFKQPATEWEEALPLGNGRIGAMVFGEPSTEHIQLNDDSMWPEDKGWEESDGNVDDLKHLRQLLFAGKNSEVDELFVEKFSRKSVTRSHQTLGDLYLDLGHENITDYRRELDISKSVARVSYKTNGYEVKEKIFVSHPHNAIILEIESEVPDGMNGKIRLSRPDDQGIPTVRVTPAKGGKLVMTGEVTQRDGQFESKPDPITGGVKFETLLQINNKGGQVLSKSNYLEMKNVKKAVFFLVSNSSYYFEDYSRQNQDDLKLLSNLTVEKLEEAHIKDYRGFFSRVKFELGEKALDTIPTDVRLERIKRGETDLGLEALLFHYGRYLLISSSREGTNPANLQGLWNRSITAPWNADYHLNINLQMNYWLANTTNLLELNYPLFDFVDRLVENGKITARKNFGCRGTFIPHATDLWAPTWLRAPRAQWGCSVGAGGWMMQQYWTYFEFTQDKEFLKQRAYPAIFEVAQFYSDWLVKDPRDGLLVSAPSTSPENQFLDENGNHVATCLGSAMDQQIIAEVFDNYIKTCGVLQIENHLLATIKQQREQLRPGFVVGPDGRILEWDREYSEAEPGHRHMSHLYGFHPGTSVSNKDTTLLEAIRKTLDYRLSHGGAGTGWSRAWLINLSARLLDGNMAQEHILYLLKKSMYPNLFDAHPPFQIDGNFGYTAGVAEMLLQSHEGDTLRLLPALPQAWDKGSVSGLKARGGITVDIAWENNELVKAVLVAENMKDMRILYKGQVLPVGLKAGERYMFKP
jgi:alpha-L-fucosidase 2